MAKPNDGDFGNFYKGYIELVDGENIVPILEESYHKLQDWLNGLQELDLQHAYAPDKWTLRQVLQHMIDTERVFAYRAMCFGRGEKQGLPGFNENNYATAAPALDRKWKGLAEELLTLRKASIILFRSLDKEGVLENRGIASGVEITVNALGFIMVGHILHHAKVIKERYL